MKWYSPKPVQIQVTPTLPTLTAPADKPVTVIPHHTTDSSVHQMKQPVEKQVSNDKVSDDEWEKDSGSVLIDICAEITKV